MLKRTAARLCLLVAVVALAACAELGKAPAGRAFELELEGRIALRYGTEGGNARISWRHSAAADDMLITSSLGQGIARIVRDEAQINLVTADGKEYQAADAETLTESVLGWPLPLGGLPDWVRGRPAPGRPAQLSRNDSGQVSAIAQDGWNIDYLAWREMLPARINLRHDGIQGRGAIEIRLVIDKFKSGP